MGQTPVVTRSDRSIPTIISQQSHKLRLMELDTTEIEHEEEQQLNFLCCSRMSSSKQLSVRK